MSALPRWDVSDLHSGVASRSFTDAMERFGADLARLEATFDELDIRAPGEHAPDPDRAAAIAERVVPALNDVMAQRRVLGAFVHAGVSTDSYDDASQAANGRLTMVSSRLTPLHARLAEWVAGVGVDALVAGSEQAAAHHGPLRHMELRSRHQMPEALEALHAELAPTGASAWARLHADVTSQLSAEVALPDGARRLPMAAIRGLATSPDPAVRRAAYDAERAAWPSVGTACAAALNAVKGEANVLDRRRGWPSPLDASLFANRVSRPTFEAMRAAVVASLPDFRRWLRCKARLHGHDGGLPWWDLAAPLPFPDASVSWDDGIAIVRDAFGSYGPSLERLVDRAIEGRWIDAEPRDGKRGGAFCMAVEGDRSLVFLNWSDSLDSTQTTAHELGHAYHNAQLAERTPLQRMLPMALAETASIFCETLVVERGLEQRRGSDRLQLLDVDLIGSCMVVVDIESRFRFETELFSRRRTSTLAARELDDMMLAAQAEAYGDGLDLSTAHPQMWAVKPHYYGQHFYNWPYTYGLLFGLGLFAEYRRDPERFRTGYDELLSLAGMADAEELGRRFGIDVTSEAFWIASLDVIRRRIDDYEVLAHDHGAGR